MRVPRAAVLVSGVFELVTVRSMRGLSQPLTAQQVLNGAGEKSRTPDLRITNALLYQLSYTGENSNYSGCLVAEAWA